MCCNLPKSVITSLLFFFTVCISITGSGLELPALQQLLQGYHLSAAAHSHVSHSIIMSSSSLSCTFEHPLVLNPDISGVGVRISFYLQTFLLGQFSIQLVETTDETFAHQSYSSTVPGRMPQALYGPLSQQVLGSP